LLLSYSTPGPPARPFRRKRNLAEAGASWFVVDPPADDAEKGLDALRRYGAEVIEA